jgi:hydroxyacylglutathione hydrolase
MAIAMTRSAEPQVTALPALSDNYIWALHDDRHCVIVDPGDAAVVEAFLRERGLVLTAVLITHHHSDHTAGLAALIKAHTAPVYGPADDRIDGITTALSHGDHCTLDGLELEVRVIATPGHTQSHIAFWTAPHLFAGDTLFAGGCGRLSEGTAAQMQDALQRLMALPDDTRLYCGHEYTLGNLRFAAAVEPGNTAVHQRLKDAEQLRANGQPTLPSTLAEERLTNPFVRTTVDEVLAAAQRHDPQCDGSSLAVFATLRQWKDQF